MYKNLVEMLVNSSVDGILAFDRECRYTLWNPAMERLSGVRAEELLGKCAFEVFPFLKETGEDRYFYQALEGKSVTATDRAFVVPQTGREGFFEVRYAPLQDETGEVVGGLGIIRDITERRRTEEERALLIQDQIALREAETAERRFLEELQESEKRFRQLAESIDEIFWLTDPNSSELIYISPAYEKVWGRSRESLYANPLSFLEAIHTDDRERVRAAVPQRVSGTLNQEYRVVRPDGSVRWVWARTFPIRDERGEVTRIAGIADDITERKLIEARVREQREVVETVNRIGQILSAELDMQRLMQAVTDAATELTGARFGSFFYNAVDERAAFYMPYALSGAAREAFAHFPIPRATDLFGPTFRGQEILRIDDVRQDPRYGESSPYYGMPEGHLPVTSYLAVPIISRSGEVLGGLFFGHPEPAMFSQYSERLVVGLAAQAAIAMDNARLFEAAQRARAEAETSASEKERLYREAQESSRLKDEFLATVSHELRTPLTAVLGWARILRSGSIDEATAKRALETIERNANAQAQLVEDLLDVSRIITGKLRLDVQPIELKSVIDLAVDAVRPAAEAKGVRLQVVLDALAGPISGDPDRLQQVIWNLLVNAVKFTPRDGRVEVRLERAGSHVAITVTDTGQGIKPEFLPFVFDRFRQADGTSTRQYGGLGLGLAIVRHLVELHGGRVRASSKGEGLGATFAVELPLIAASSESDAPEERALLSATEPLAEFDTTQILDGLRVLVVDDEDDACELISTILEQKGAEVATVQTAADALLALARFQPDVLISDIEMPHEDGYTLIKKIRELDPQEGGRTPAAALTAYARTEDRMRALLAGFQIHIPKPVEPAELIAVVANLAERRGKAISTDSNQ